MKPNDNTRLIDLTLGELLDEVERRVRKVMASQPQADGETPRYVYGLKGLARLFGCSKTSASRLKASGDIDKAITQIGQLLIVDAKVAIEEAAKAKQRRNKR